jgi:hypothetical protein
MPIGEAVSEVEGAICERFLDASEAQVEEISRTEIEKQLKWTSQTIK